MSRLVTAAALFILTDAALAAGLVFAPPPDSAAHYPEQALRERIEGRAIVACTLGMNGALIDCAVKSEEPQGYAFGLAGIAAVADARVDIGASELTGSIGRQIAIPLVFKLSPAPEPVDPSPAS